MAIQYKNTKLKKEKPVKAPKEPKAAKPAKKDNSVKVKISKTAKVVKAPKEAKPAKAEKAPKVKINKSAKQPKAKNNVKLNDSTSPKKVNSKKIVVPLIIMLALVLVVVLITVVVNIKMDYDKQIARVLVSTPPKLQYFAGERPNYEGLKLQVVLNNGESYFVDASECEISGFDSSKAVERQTITVSYQGFQCAYQIMIKEAPKPSPILSEIYLETLPQKTQYKVGEWLDTTGGVLMVKYTDGTYMRHNLIIQDVYGFVTDVKNETYVTQQAGTYTLEIRYREGGVTKTCTYEITVTE